MNGGSISVSPRVMERRQPSAPVRPIGEQGGPCSSGDRYADDFVVFVSGSYEDALREKEMLARYLKNTAKLDFSKDKNSHSFDRKGI